MKGFSTTPDQFFSCLSRKLSSYAGLCVMREGPLDHVAVGLAARRHYRAGLRKSRQGTVTGQLAAELSDLPVAFSYSYPKWIS